MGFFPSNLLVSVAVIGWSLQLSPAVCVLIRLLDRSRSVAKVIVPFLSDLLLSSRSAVYSCCKLLTIS